MNIGAAIKTLRIKKLMKQNELAEKSGLSVNALSMIEKDKTFPKKETIKKICEALQIPVCFLLFFSIDEDDVPSEKKVVFNSLSEAVKTLILDLVNY